MVDVERAIEGINGNRYDSVLVFAQRTREIHRRAREKQESTYLNDALIEAQSGAIAFEDYILKIK